jgi:hypothetical protein
VYPGCDGTPEVCEGVFDNPENFEGYLYIPKVEQTVL